MLQHYLCNCSIRLAQKAVWEGEYEKAFNYLDEFMSAARTMRNAGMDKDISASPILPKEKTWNNAITKESILFRLSWSAFNPIRKDLRFKDYVQEIEGWE